MCFPIATNYVFFITIDSYTAILLISIGVRLNLIILNLNGHKLETEEAFSYVCIRSRLWTLSNNFVYYYNKST